MTTHRIRLHFRGYTDAGNRSDKVYVIVVQQHESGHYAVNAQWGRRGGKMSSQNKGMYANLWGAVAALNSLAGEKIAKGYEVTERLSNVV